MLPESTVLAENNNFELDAFMQSFATSSNSSLTLSYSYIDSPIGSLIAIASETELYLLEFFDYNKIYAVISKLTKALNCDFVFQKNTIISTLEKELDLYFSKGIESFSVPIFSWGTNFQQDVWNALQDIPYGQTISYAELASNVKRPKSFRAAANANGNNRVVIVIPCHRVVASDGSLGGYSAGIDRKEWLLNHEKQFV